jgi:hypothetical protein
MRVVRIQIFVNKQIVQHTTWRIWLFIQINTDSRLYSQPLRPAGRRISMGSDPLEARCATRSARTQFGSRAGEVAMSKLVSVVVLLAAAGFAMAARGTPQNAPASDQPAAAPTTNPANHSAIKPGDRNCLRDTGSLIPAKKGECLPVTGHSYSKKDIDSTGETTIGPALQKLDPSVTIRGNGY